MQRNASTRLGFTDSFRVELAKAKFLNFRHSGATWARCQPPFHCRSGGLGHARPPAAPYYDVAYGPVAAFWMQRIAMNGAADQISFHSSACTPILVVKGVSPV
jgi:hypothetical protein